jgi:predicted RNase H-like HicB family nuclease
MYMKLVYPVIITKDGEFLLASIPDCDIDTQGKNIAEAIEMARDAISIWCVCEQDAGRELPIPSELSALKTGADQIATLVDVDIDAYRCILDNRTIRKNLTIPARLNSFAEANNINFSQVLKDALEQIYQGSLQPAH